MTLRQLFLWQTFDEELTDFLLDRHGVEFSAGPPLFLALKNPGTLRLAKVEKLADGTPKLIQNPLSGTDIVFYIYCKRRHFLLTNQRCDRTSFHENILEKIHHRKTTLS